PASDVFVFLRPEHQSKTWSSVSPAPTDFLVIPIKALRKRGVKNGTDVTLVDTQAECRRGDHQIDGVRAPAGERSLAFGIRTPSMKKAEAAVARAHELAVPGDRIVPAGCVQNRRPRKLSERV